MVKSDKSKDGLVSDDSGFIHDVHGKFGNILLRILEFLFLKCFFQVLPLKFMKIAVNINEIRVCELLSKLVIFSSY